MHQKELILINGDIITLSERKEHAASISVKEGRISAINPPLPKGISTSDEREVIDLNGRTVLPGFSDCHSHLTHIGLTLTCLDFKETTSLSDIFDRLADALKDHPKDEVLLAWNFNETLFREKRFPTLAELDRVSAKIPIWINRLGMSSSVFNTKAWEGLGISPDLPSVPKDSQGNLLGCAFGHANHLALAKVFNSLTDEVRLEAYKAAAARYAGRGITTVHAMEGSFSPHMLDRPDFAPLEIPCLIQHKDLIDLDVVIWDQHMIDWQKYIGRVKGYSLPRIGGDIFVDGVLGAALTKGSLRAALSEPYYDDPSTYGNLVFTDEDLEKLVWLSWQADLQFAAHAVGDRAFVQLMNAYKMAYQKKPGNGRFRIEHGLLPDHGKLKLAGELGVIFSMQPAFDFLSGGPEGLYASRIGLHRAHLTNPFQAILNSGCLIAAGSDAPTFQIDPILGIHSMVNHHYPEQRTSSLDALKALTINAAYSVCEEGIKGSLETGKQADFVVLSSNPLTVHPSKIKDIQVEMTIYRGKITFRSPTF